MFCVINRITWNKPVKVLGNLQEKIFKKHEKFSVLYHHTLFIFVYYLAGRFSGENRPIHQTKAATWANQTQRRLPDSEKVDSRKIGLSD